MLIVRKIIEILFGIDEDDQSVIDYIKEEIAEDLKKYVWPLYENGKIKPVLYKTFPLEKACEAHVLMESSKHIGKIMLNCN